MQRWATGSCNSILGPLNNALDTNFCPVVQGEEFGGPPPRAAGASLDELAGDAQKILSIMVDRGYAIKVAASSCCTALEV